MLTNLEFNLAPGHKQNTNQNTLFAPNSAFCWLPQLNAAPPVVNAHTAAAKWGRHATAADRQCLTARHRRQTNGHSLMSPTPSVTGFIIKIGIDRDIRDVEVVITV